MVSVDATSHAIDTRMLSAASLGVPGLPVRTAQYGTVMLQPYKHVLTKITTDDGNEFTGLTLGKALSLPYLLLVRISKEGTHGNSCTQHSRASEKYRRCSSLHPTRGTALTRYLAQSYKETIASVLREHREAYCAAHSALELLIDTLSSARGDGVIQLGEGRDR
jgi:hypothetical protein